jgi:hypothetical protein
MVAAIRQTVTVREDGKVEVLAPELRTGDITEVIVLMPSSRVPSAASRLEALDRLQAELKLNQREAERWIQEVNDERRAI